MTETIKLKSGIITLVGRSNVGKSTLLNTLVGTKIAAVTDKPQTTRNIIHGVLNRAEGQAVFVDAPGVFKEHRGRLSSILTDRVQESLKQIDLVLYVVDPGKPIGAEERFTLSILRKLTMPKLLIINKSDLPKTEKAYLEDYEALAEEFSGRYILSALHASHITPLIQKVFELLPEGEPYYPEGQLTNIDKKFWVAEIIREKIFLALRKEVPYTTHVEIESIEEKQPSPRGRGQPARHASQGEAGGGEGSSLFVIKARVLTLERRYKEMIIGKGGRAIKEIGIAARKELEQALGKKVFLELEVEVDKHWLERV